MQHTNTRRGFTQIVVNKKGHSRGLLSGIYNACRGQIKENSLLNRYVEDPRQKPSGMTPNFTTAYGFTLIELLVVVLIIGILVAVAVPQYQKAVLKSKYARFKPLVQSIVQAEQVYYLANQEYTRKPEDLDIEIPAGWQRSETDPAKYFFDWGSMYLGVDNKNGICFVEARNTDMMYHVDVVTGNRLCIAYTLDTNAPQSKICQQETGKTNPTGGNATSYLEWSY